MLVNVFLNRWYSRMLRMLWFGDCCSTRWMRYRHGSVNVAVLVVCDTVMVRWMLPCSLYAIPSWFGECCRSRWMRYRYGSVNVAVLVVCDTVMVRWMLQYPLDVMTSFVRTEVYVYNTEMALSVACVLQHTRAFTVNRRKVTKRRNTSPVVWIGMIKWDSSLRKTLRLIALLYMLILKWVCIPVISLHTQCKHVKRLVSI